MRILHVTDGYLPRLGGIELHVHDLVAQQRRAGHDARILTLTPGDGQDPAHVTRVRGDRPGAPPSLRTAADHLDRLLRLHARRPWGDPGVADVVHVHISVFSPFATLAAHRFAHAGMPTLITVHSMWVRLGPLPSAARDLLDLRTWPVVWSAVSERAAQPIRSLLGEDHTVHVLANAVDVASWYEARPTHAEQRPPTAPLTVVSVMRLTRVKRTLPLGAILRDVERRVPRSVPFRAVVIGEGPQGARLERFVAEHQLAGTVTLTGRLDRCAIREQLRAAAVFLAPAEKESFGIAALEARTVGLPVVASSKSGVSQFVEHGVNGLLGATDRDLSHHVRTLLTDDTLRQRIAHHNRVVPSGYDWPRAVRDADLLYAITRSSRVEHGAAV